MKYNMSRFMSKIGANILMKLGLPFPSRTDRFLNAIIEIISFFYRGTNRKRKKFLLKKRIYTYFYGGQILKTAKSIGKNFYCGSPSCVNSNTIIKDYVCFNGMYINGGGNVIIGSYFHSGIECMIITQNHDYDTGALIPYGIGYSYKDVVIEDFVWLGRRVTILPGTKIGEGAIIQAGAVVHGNIPPYAIAGGNPAIVFKYREVEHFKKLKDMGKVFSDELYCDLRFHKN